MASFLQNNGDIILDAVLTDYGRKLLARGDGSFNIVKFALGDDEIDYGLFKPNESSINQDADILSTPILEAFSNNAASMKSKLITLGMQNILYMPILKINTSLSPFYDDKKAYVVPVNTTSQNTVDALSKLTVSISGINPSDSARLDLTTKPGTINGGEASLEQKFITVDQGIDSPELDGEKSLQDTNNMLYESAYNIHVDSRFCSVGDNAGGSLIPESIDDDGMAVYSFTEQSADINNAHVSKIDENVKTDQVIDGTKGSRLKFTIVPTENLSSDTYFDKYGEEISAFNSSQTEKIFKTLRMPVKIVGKTTGYMLEIPVIFAKVKP